MIWLASYPRSGNTFLRIVLHEVYGIESRVFRLTKLNKRNQRYVEFPLVKTHVLPHELNPVDKDIKAVYLVRDGRDAVVSMAHQRKDIMEPGSDFELNLKAVIRAEEGTHFGGWSQHVSDWLPRASLVIRFEDLIVDPIKETEKLRPFLDMPEPDISRLPDFNDLKNKDMPYGAGSRPNYTEEEKGIIPGSSSVVGRWVAGKMICQIIFIIYIGSNTVK